MQTHKEQVTWTTFKMRFLEKYFPNSAEHERKVEFFTLQQGTMTVQAYTDRFEYLTRFYLPVVTKEWRCRKLRADLNMSCAGSSCHSRSENFQFWSSRPKQLNSWRWGPTKWQDRRRPPQTLDNRINHIVDYGKEHLRRDFPKPSTSFGSDISTDKCYICEQTRHFA